MLGREHPHANNKFYSIWIAITLCWYTANFHISANTACLGWYGIKLYIPAFWQNKFGWWRIFKEMLHNLRIHFLISHFTFYAPSMSVDIARSFSVFTNILTDRNKLMTILRKHLLVTAIPNTSLYSAANWVMCRVSVSKHVLQLFTICDDWIKVIFCLKTAFAYLLLPLFYSAILHI